MTAGGELLGLCFLTHSLRHVLPHTGFLHSLTLSSPPSHPLASLLPASHRSPVPPSDPQRAPDALALDDELEDEVRRRTQRAHARAAVQATVPAPHGRYRPRCSAACALTPLPTSTLCAHAAHGTGQLCAQVDDLLEWTRRLGTPTPTSTQAGFGFGRPGTGDSSGGGSTEGTAAAGHHVGAIRSHRADVFTLPQSPPGQGARQSRHLYGEAF